MINMAILKQRLNRKNSSGGYDTIYLETVATVVKMSESDSTTVATAINNRLPLSGGTLTGNLTGQYITGTWLRTTDVSNKAGDFATIDNKGWIYKRTASEVNKDIISGNHITPTIIELFPGESAGHGGYIDFHYNNDSADYTSRIMEVPKGVIKYNNREILSTANIIALRNVNLTFTDGIATYSNTDVNTSSVTFVQWRAGAVSTLTDSVLSTTANNGSITIVAKIGFTGGPLPVNILIINL